MGGNRSKVSDYRKERGRQGKRGGKAKEVPNRVRKWGLAGQLVERLHLAWLMRAHLRPCALPASHAVLAWWPLELLVCPCKGIYNTERLFFFFFWQLTLKWLYKQRNCSWNCAQTEKLGLRTPGWDPELPLQSHTRTAFCGAKWKEDSNLQVRKKETECKFFCSFDLVRLDWG